MHRAPIHTAEKAEKLTPRPGRATDQIRTPRRVDPLNAQPSLTEINRTPHNRPEVIQGPAARRDNSPRRKRRENPSDATPQPLQGPAATTTAATQGKPAPYSVTSSQETRSEEKTPAPHKYPSRRQNAAKGQQRGQRYRPRRDNTPARMDRDAQQAQESPQQARSRVIYANLYKYPHKLQRPAKRRTRGQTFKPWTAARMDTPGNAAQPANYSRVTLYKAR